jgi:hypothetical protein
MMGPLRRLWLRAENFRMPLDRVLLPLTSVWVLLFRPLVDDTVRAPLLVKNWSWKCDVELG